MPRLAPKLLELEKVEPEELEKIVARHNTSQQIAKRAKIVILASLGKNHRRKTQGSWTSVERWQDYGETDGKS